MLFFLDESQSKRASDYKTLGLYPLIPSSLCHHCQRVPHKDSQTKYSKTKPQFLTLSVLDKVLSNQSSFLIDPKTQQRGIFDYVEKILNLQWKKNTDESPIFCSGYPWTLGLKWFSFLSLQFGWDYRRAGVCLASGSNILQLKVSLKWVQF